MSDVLNSLVPDYQFSEHHTTVVLAQPVRVFEAVEAMDITDSTIAKALMRLWRIPARIYNKEIPDRYMSVNDFMPLIRTPPHDLMRGLLGGRNAPKDKNAVDAAAFREFNEPGCMKLVWGIWLTVLGDDRVRIDTETRVFCTDAKTVRLFRLYWTIIRPWSGLIRMRLLASIKRQAESS